MFCPRCGANAAPGAQRCPECAAPFTTSARRKSASRPGTRPAAAVPAGYRSYQRGTGVGRAVVAWLAVLFLAAVAVLALITVFSSSVVKPFVGRQIEQSLAQPTATAAPIAQAPPPVATTAPVAGSSQVVVTEGQLNDQIAQHQSDIGPLDSVTVKIVPTELQVTMKSHGLSGTYHGNVVVQGGKPVLTGGHVDGLLGHVIPTAQLEDVLNQQIDGAVVKSGVSVQTVTLQQGQMVVDYA